MSAYVLWNLHAGHYGLNVRLGTYVPCVDSPGSRNARVPQACEQCATGWQRRHPRNMLHEV